MIDSVIRPRVWMALLLALAWPQPGPALAAQGQGQSRASVVVVNAVPADVPWLSVGDTFVAVPASVIPPRILEALPGGLDRCYSFFLGTHTVRVDMVEDCIDGEPAAVDAFSLKVFDMDGTARSPWLTLLPFGFEKVLCDARCSGSRLILMSAAVPGLEYGAEMVELPRVDRALSGHRGCRRVAYAARGGRLLLTWGRCAGAYRGPPPGQVLIEFSPWDPASATVRAVVPEAAVVRVDASVPRE